MQFRSSGLPRKQGTGLNQYPQIFSGLRFFMTAQGDLPFSRRSAFCLPSVGQESNFYSRRPFFATSSVGISSRVEPSTLDALSLFGHDAKIGTLNYLIEIYLM